MSKAVLLLVVLALSGCDWFSRSGPSEKRNFEKAEPFAQRYEPGVYKCTKCGSVLFSSEKKLKQPAAQWPVFSEGEPGAVRLPTTALTASDAGTIVCSKCNLHVGFSCRVDAEHPAGVAEVKGPHVCAYSSSMTFESSVGK